MLVQWAAPKYRGTHCVVVAAVAVVAGRSCCRTCSLDDRTYLNTGQVGSTCLRPEKLSTCPRPDRQQVPVWSQSGLCRSIYRQIRTSRAGLYCSIYTGHVRQVYIARKSRAMRACSIYRQIRACLAGIYSSIYRQSMAGRVGIYR